LKFNVKFIVKFNVVIFVKALLLPPLTIITMKLKFTLLTLFFMSLGFAQVTNEGRPYSWDSDLEEVAPVEMPKFDLERIKAEDIANDGKDKPWRFGYEFLVYNSLENSGMWTTLENGDRVWRIRYKSEGAKTLNFLFNDFYMPEGGKVYLYDVTRSDLLGAYDSQQNNEANVLGTWLVTGDDIYIEYYEPADKAGEGRLEVAKVIHGYRTMGGMNKDVDDGLNQSGICNMDVNCSIPSINTLKDINKRAVAIMIVGSNSFCSGALINNTSNNGVPYFLTANHCYEGMKPGSMGISFQLDKPKSCMCS
jgi:lysyl endopeptidase